MNKKDIQNGLFYLNKAAQILEELSKHSQSESVTKIMEKLSQKLQV